MTIIAASVTPFVQTVSPIAIDFGRSVGMSQVSFAVAIAFDCLHSFCNDAKFKFVTYARMIEKESNYTICEKTAANAGSTARKIAVRYAVQLAQYQGGLTSDNVTAFTLFLSTEAKTAGYVLTNNDINAFCSGEKSTAQRRADLEAVQALAAETMAKAALATSEAEQVAMLKAQEEASDKLLADSQATLAKVEADKAEADSKAQAAEQALKDSAARAKALESDNAKLAQLADVERIKNEALKAQAEEARKVAESVCIKVMVSASGAPMLELNTNMSPEFLREVAAQLYMQANALEAEQQAALSSPMISALVTAKKKSKKAPVLQAA